ncbi:MAG: PKD domain-containing protein [Brumimicrobium sp.]|nr:PKD domain-containing protein [Brumimicrobium sp.]
MSDKIEKAFREKLQNFEVPYDASAWQAVNARLDANSGALSSGKSFGKMAKWISAAVVVGAIVAGVYYLSGNNKSIVVNDKQEVNKNTIIENETSEIKNDNTAVAIDDTQKLASSETDNQQVDKTNVEAEKLELNNTSNATTSKTTLSSTPVIEGNDSNDNQSKDNGGAGTLISTEFVVGQFIESTVCEGANVTIQNPEVKNGKVRFKMDNKWIMLNPTESYSFVATSSTTIEFVNKNGEVIGKEYLSVMERPTVNFNYKANIFDEGLPVTMCTADGNFVSYTWTFDKDVISGNGNAKYYFFEKGDYTVNLKVKDMNGCENEMSKNIHIKDNYNLMAVDAFRPNDADLRNTTFMPYSLTQRDVKFQMIIIDPTDNGIIFTSSNAENAWGGMDQRTGKMTPANKEFIWKVQIYNPVRNERPVYTGTIIHD